MCFNENDGLPCDRYLSIKCLVDRRHICFASRDTRIVILFTDLTSRVGERCSAGHWPVKKSRRLSDDFTVSRSF